MIRGVPPARAIIRPAAQYGQWCRDAAPAIGEPRRSCRYTMLARRVTSESAPGNVWVNIETLPKA
ncbi:hypothetical protein C5O80_05350 [Burkholderia sp. SRS-46]|nr:hypothetical protein C5O80_05350 [Burkholderia sp. SRS-46]